MAELALAIIPLGITVTSGLTKYLKAFNDHDDDRARLVRQAERFESTFQSLDAALKRSELDPGLSSSASEAHASLKECHKALKELEALQQKVFVTTTSVASTAPHARKKDKIKGGFITSVTSTAINELRQPISKIDLALPVLQTSVDSVIPHFDHRFDQISYQIAYQNSQMQAQIKSLLDTAELTGYLDRPGTSQQRLQDRFEGQGNCLSTNETDWEFTALANRDHLVSMCSCPSRRMRQDKWFGQGSIHFADEMLSYHSIDRPDILRVLAKKAKPEDWIRRSLDDATSLNLAIQASREICHSGDVLDESCCPCTLPLRIILSAGCPIIPYRDFRCSMFSPSPKESFFESSTHCKILLTKELRNRRRQLRDLAKSKLSITEFSRFATLEEVPDVEAIGMDSLLRQKDILGQGPLSSFVDGDLPPHPQQDVRYCSRSIFFDLKSPEDADLFVDSGFNMLCANRDHDSSLDRMLFAKISPDRRFISLDYAIWLFEHQAPLWKWSYRFTNPMPSAFVLADILGIQDYKCSGQENSGDKAEHYLGESILVDDCTCLCSPRGCTPFASRMKWLAHSHDEPQDHTPQDIATKFGYYVETYGDRLDLKHHLIMVRQATFAALELKHTCLDRPAYSNCPGHPHWIYMLDPVTELGPDEVEFETLNVDVEAKNQLESVVTKFQDFVLTGDQMTVSSKVKSFDVDHSVSNNQSVVGVADLYCQRALEFWKHIWENRIQDALEAVAKGWDNRLNGENDVVQISTCEEAMQEAANGFGEENDEVIFNGIIQQIQDI
ncbi:hypothetical protein BFJ72_g9570 [Fusarium proliferatum]|uniref:Fungal N-terminal domain-containing protein n=1 Tax=Gibberella intermedia TaxID=948311 RepID=A0A420SXS5_GIBIN|nr:hypothetical protein BFJ72_g9570 [Fusarium proliferatum]